MPFGVALARFVEFAEQFFLAIGQIDRRFDDDVAEQVAVAAHALDALAAQTEDFPRLRFGRNLQICCAVERRDFNLAAERAAVVKLIGISQCRSFCSRWKTGCALR